MTLLNIVYEDEALLVVDKPAGLLMHPSWLDRREKDTLATRVKEYLQLSHPEQKVHTIHRLDRPTSGLVLIAKDHQAAKALIEQFRQRQVKKTYWAICRGFAPEAEAIDHPLKEEQDKIADDLADKDKAAQSALTHIRRLAIAEQAVPVSRYNKARLSLMECRPVTGRKHQIRRHLKHIRHPILGDTRHGCRHMNHAFTDELQGLSLALRAVELTFMHPLTGQKLTVQAPPDAIWTQWFRQFGWTA